VPLTPVQDLLSCRPRELCCLPPRPRFLISFILSLAVLEKWHYRHTHTHSLSLSLSTGIYKTERKSRSSSINAPPSPCPELPSQTRNEQPLSRSLTKQTNPLSPADLDPDPLDMLKYARLTLPKTKARKHGNPPDPNAQVANVRKSVISVLVNVELCGNGAVSSKVEGPVEYCMDLGGNVCTKTGLCGLFFSSPSWMVGRVRICRTCHVGGLEKRRMLYIYK
jgi:hypothetical protein